MRIRHSLGIVWGWLRANSARVRHFCPVPALSSTLPLVFPCVPYCPTPEPGVLTCSALLPPLKAAQNLLPWSQKTALLFPASALFCHCSPSIRSERHSPLNGECYSGPSCLDSWSSVPGRLQHTLFSKWAVSRVWLCPASPGPGGVTLMSHTELLKPPRCLG